MSRPRLFALLLASLPLFVDLFLTEAGVDLGLVHLLLRAYSVLFALALLGWLTSRALRSLLWRVSRRLAFSYFLIGLVPIPLLAILLGAAIYVAGGFVLGHLYRDALLSVATELRLAARQQAALLAEGIVPVRASDDAAGRAPGVVAKMAYYRKGRKIAGAPEAPEVWVDAWVEETLELAPPSPESMPLVALEPPAPASAEGAAETTEVDGELGPPTLAAAAAAGDFGVLAIFDGDLATELAERSGVWVELFRSDAPPAEQPDDDRVATVTLGGREYPLKLPSMEGRPELADFFHPGVAQPSWVDRPFLLWVEVSRPFLDLATGEPIADHVSAQLTGSPRTLLFHLFSRSAEVDVFVYGLFVAVAFLLFDLYLVAALMALYLSYGLSRAVNQLTKATREIQAGNFATRIAVRRTDQVGALQTSFNRMAANLEDLVHTAAQKESLEAELTIARELQRSLLPDAAAVPEGLVFSTYFEPSTAIGGDYYDFLPLAADRLAVFIGDVSGHGVSAGLRMAMLKSALQLLCEPGETRREPEAVLKRLHALVRSGGPRGFVTATLAVVDVGAGTLEVCNAGHPPTYLLRRGEVEEILLPGSPLGVLDGVPGRRTLALEPGDVVVWLSDGLIEATRGEGDVFGYEQVVATLRGDGSEPDAVRDRLLAAVAAHRGDRAPDDDLTLVAMAYRPAATTVVDTGAGVAAGASHGEGNPSAEKIRAT